MASNLSLTFIQTEHFVLQWPPIRMNSEFNGNSSIDFIDWKKSIIKSLSASQRNTIE